MWNNTTVTQLLKIKYPITQGPFGGRFSSVKLVSSVSNLGGMGSFGLNSYQPEEILEVNKEISSQTSNPYALNLWVPIKDDPANRFTDADFEKVKKKFSPYFERVGADLPKEMNRETQNFERQVEALLESKPAVASFIFGIPSKEIIKELKKREIIIAAVATTFEEAIAIENAGIDLVITSGMEAGGHRASFLNLAEKSLSSTVDLIQKVKANIDIPIIAAGGISTGADIIKVLNQGARAAQLGTVFLATEESNASVEHKSMLLSQKKIETKLTTVFTGRLARVIDTDFVREVDKEGEIAPYPIQSAFLGPLRKAAKESNLLDYEAFWAGQPTSAITHKTTANLFKSLINEIELGGGI